jgi:RNA polymerase sigma-70 factor (ECF subfamily)
LNQSSGHTDYPIGEKWGTPMIREVGQVFDEILVLYAQAGRREALDRLASRWRPRHLAHARRLLGSNDRAADAVQDAWVSIVRGLWRLNDPTRFPGWSYAILTRRCQDMMRRAGRAHEMPLDENFVDESFAEHASALDLRDGLNALPADQLAAVALFYREGLAVVEIAEALRVPVGTVKTRLFHARRALRRHLAGDES